MKFINPNEHFDSQLTFGQRIADRVAAFGGSWTFIMIFLGSMGVWMIYNSSGPGRFDPYPYIFLNLVLSCLAALQAPVIMMSQNRQATRDRMDDQLDYEINVRAEQEITEMRSRIGEMAEALVRIEAALAKR